MTTESEIALAVRTLMTLAKTATGFTEPRVEAVLRSMVTGLASQGAGELPPAEPRVTVEMVQAQLDTAFQLIKAMEKRHAAELNLAQQGAGKLPQDERAAFEALGSPRGYVRMPLDVSDLDYVDSITQAQWEGFQAALAQRAASVPAEAVQPHYMVVGKKGGWIDANKDLYDAAADWNRRILYAAPVPAASVQTKTESVKNGKMYSMAEPAIGLTKKC